MSWTRQDWNQRVVAYLAECKAAGCDFDASWYAAIAEHPPRGRDLGPERPTLFGIDGDVSLVAFMRQACSDAWFGRRPALAHFHASLLQDHERSGPAVRQRRLAA